MLVTAALVAACTAARDSAAPIHRDSAGVSLIEYPTTFAASGGRHWSTDPDPIFSIGEKEPELFIVETALFQSDGGVVVANGGASELLLFDPNGRLRARAGGQGGGPGELHQLSSLSIGPGDSLFVYDARERRLSVFDPGGAFARALTLQGVDTLGNAMDVGVLRSGEIIAAFSRHGAGTGLVRDSVVVVTFAPSGTPTALLGVFPHVYVDLGPHTTPGGGTAAYPVPALLSGMTAVSPGDRAIFVGVPEPYSLTRISTSGSLRVTRQRDLPPAVTDADRERFVAALELRRSAVEERDMVRRLRSPPTLPAFGFDPMTSMVGEQALLVTDAGGVWLHPFQFPHDSTAAPWPRFDAEGLYEGTVTLPPRFRATAVRGDVVLGVYMDSTDVEVVRAYRLVAQR